MVYSKFFLEKKNQLLLPIIGGVLGITLFFLLFINLIIKKAHYLKASYLVINKLTVGNITANSAIVYWRSEKEATGWVIYGTEKNKLNMVALDERDLNDKKNQYKNHYVSLRNLKENTTYFFAIVNNSQIIDNNKQFFTFKTLTNNSQIKNLSLAYGKVVNNNNLPIKEAVVSLTYNKKDYFLTLTKSSGEWVVPINIIENTQIPKEIFIEIISEKGETSSIVADIKNINPLPKNIIIGNNYEFVENEEKVLSLIDQNFKNQEEVEIFYPLENAVIAGRKPLIKGRAAPNAEVSLIIEGLKNFFAKLKSNSDGLWSYTAPALLPIGRYKLKIITKDKNNNEIVKERIFYIKGSSGSSVLGEATPSATIIISPTAIPTQSFLSLTPTSEYPISGINFISLSYLSLAMIILGLGFLLVF